MDVVADKSAHCDDRPAGPNVTPKADSHTPGTASGYKIVKIRKPDGSIITVKRPVKPEGPGDGASTALPAGPQDSPGAKPFKIVTVRKADGSLVKVKRPVPLVESSDSPAKTGASSEASHGTGNSPSPATNQPSQDELDDQMANRRARKMHRFKSSLTRGLATAIASAIPSIDITEGFHDGDEILSDGELSGSADDDELDTGTGNEQDLAAPTVDANAALGSVATAAAAGTAGQPPPRHVPQGKGPTVREKITYKVTEEEKDKQDLEAATKPLQRHWASFSFYFLASLSIILPVLFFILAGFIIGMKDKRVGSSWSKIENAIKFAISAWPIVFAAVVAQGFKAFATYKVERGIKLMELEQLVGCNSFGNAMKQPFLLRRLDILTIALFSVWCLSPIGSQALQRCYGEGRNVQSDEIDLYYVDYTGRNDVWGPQNGYDVPVSDAVGRLNETKMAELVQVIATYHIGNLAPTPYNKNVTMDQYSRPILTFVDDNSTDVSGYGVPIALPLPKIDYYDPTALRNEEKLLGPPSETLSFPMVASYFNFTCGPWSQVSWETLNESYYVNDTWRWSPSKTFVFNMMPADVYPDYPNKDEIYVASRNDAPAIGNSTNRVPDSTDPEPEWQFSLIGCKWNQVFFDTEVRCDRDPSTLLANCARSAPEVLTTANSTNGINGTGLFDFTSEFAYVGNPNTIFYPSTAMERNLQDGGKLDALYLNPVVNLSQNVEPDEFAKRFAYLFNTWVHLGYCPTCLTIPDTESMAYNNLTSFYRRATSTRTWSSDVVYTINWPWLSVFIACTAGLLVTGIASVVVESKTVAPDILGYVSTVARNSRYLHLPKTNSAMSGGQRARALGGVEVMMQDVQAQADVGKIALGLKHEKAKRLEPGRLYR